MREITVPTSAAGSLSKAGKRNVAENIGCGAASGLRDRCSPDHSVSALRKRKNRAPGVNRVDIECKPDTLVISG